MLWNRDLNFGGGEKGGRLSVKESPFAIPMINIPIYGHVTVFTLQFLIEICYVVLLKSL